MIFREVQRFRQLWIYAVVIGLMLLGLWTAVQQLVLGIPFGNNPIADSWLIFLCADLLLLFPLWFYNIKMVTEVHNDGLEVRFRRLPFAKRHIQFSDIQAAEVRQYNSWLEYSGWGVRYGFGKRWAFNVSGPKGVQLILKSGQYLLIGSQQADELLAALELKGVKVDND